MGEPGNGVRGHPSVVDTPEQDRVEFPFSRCSRLVVEGDPGGFGVGRL